MGKFEPTKSQIEAIYNSFGCNVSVSAGAGSGKTEVLVQRFCNIVEQGLADVDEILTVTFTEKAAREMKERIVKHFGDLAESDSTGRFESAIRGLESAYIGTIHSFASRLLRENAFEAGIDPGFSMLTEAESIMLKNAVVEEMVSEKNADQDEVFQYLLTILGDGCLRSSVLKLYSHFSSLGKAVSEGESAYNPPVEISSIVKEYYRRIDAIKEAMAVEKMSDSLLKSLNEFFISYPNLQTFINRFESQYRSLSVTEYASEFNWQEYSDLVDIKKLAGGNVGTAAQKDQYIKPMKQAAEDLLQAIIQPVLQYTAEGMLQLTEEFTRRYADAKQNLGSLDFDDLLLHAQRLLLADGKPTSTALHYKNKFKYVILDEFQDTNVFQKRLVESVSRPGTMFTVGDVKQSIYSFIHSDVSVFIDHHTSVADSDSGKTLAFTENFRSNSNVVGFVNWLFEQLWGQDNEFVFEKLQAMREFCKRDEPDIELILVPRTENAEQARKDEASTVAKRIREMLGKDGHPPLQITTDTDTRDLKPDDILILFRSTTNISVYENALFDAGIDFYVVSGRGFYSMQEVRDLLAMLQIVDNPLDDVAMAEVLRSPIAAISDDALWWLTRKYRSSDGDESETLEDTDIPARNRNIGKLYASLQNLDKLDQIGESDRTRLQEFRDILSRLHAMRSSSRISMLIDSIVRETHFDLKLLASTNGKRKYANICKLLGIAEEMHSRGMFSISDFVGYIQDLAEVSATEGDASTETENSPVVKLMTVHKAKGLQAPVVIVADSSHKIRSGDNSPFLSDQTGKVVCKIKGPLSDDWIQNNQYDNLCSRLKARDIAEEKRLFYVAATRAEEKLVVSGFSDFNGNGLNKSFEEIGAWSGWLEKAMDISAEPARKDVISAGGIYVSLLTGYDSDATQVDPDSRTLLQKYRKELVSGEMLQTDNKTTSEFTDVEILKNRAGVQKISKPALQLSVSQVLDYGFCPVKYYLKWILGIPEEHTDGDEEIIDRTDEAYSGATLGSAVHQVLGAFDFRGDPEPQLQRLCSIYDTGLRKQVENCCRMFIKSSWYDRIKSARNIMQEVPFRVLTGEHSLVGRIDLLMEDDTGWTVLDYKTGKMQERDRYQQQVSLYASAVQSCLNIAPSKIALLSLGSSEDCIFDVDQSMLEDTAKWLESTFNNIADSCFDADKKECCLECGYNVSENNSCSLCAVKGKEHD